MDNQPIVPPTPVPSSTPVPSMPAPQTGPVVTSNGSGSKSKMIMIVVILVVVLVALVAGGAYYYLNMQQATTPAAAPVVTQPTSQVVPSPSPDAQQQLNAINVDDGSTDFAPVDKDLQSL